MNLNDLYFGDLEAFDEFQNNPLYFKGTFLLPESVNLKALRNNNKFIVTGRKEVGKTALQVSMADQLRSDGYKTIFFRFADDITAETHNELSKSQSHISLVSAANDKKLFFGYDFREIWKRIYIRKIAESFVDSGIDGRFTKFVTPDRAALRNIFSGIGKNFKVKITGEAYGVALGLGVDFDGGSDAASQEISISDFNKIALNLFKDLHRDQKVYMFIDELVFSRLDAREDEVTIRAAMVRDILKAARELNQFFSNNSLDVHFICSLRPEVRNLINEKDSEIGKLLDGKDVDVSWYIRGDGSRPMLLDVFAKKIEFSVNTPASHDKLPPLNYRTFMAQTIEFGGREMSIDDFIKTNTWGRPRDLVRLLTSIQKASPNATYIGEQQVKAGLDHYSRTSLKELVDELSVNHGSDIITVLKNSIKRKNYESRAEFIDQLRYVAGNAEALFDELFLVGVLGGVLDGGRYHWAHRGETYFKDEFKVRIHPALWNEFAIRSR